jgi:hypothetical protein
MMLIGFYLAVPSSFIAAATIHVPADQPTLQAAIDAAASGDSISIADGVYAGSAFVMRAF